MVGTRTLARLLDLAARDGATLAAVGDPAQLPSSTPAGCSRPAPGDLGAAVLTDNLRQVEPWEHQALRQIRAGRAQVALTAYTTSGTRRARPQHGQAGVPGTVPVPRN